jgi:NAD-dependent deacetylase
MLLIVTGAGVSSASGIRTFRGPEPGAIWREHDIALATVEYFERDPVGQLSWYLERFSALDSARPNPAHHAIADIERHLDSDERPVLLVTQNIDTLHEQAGSSRMIKVHGTGDRLRCGGHGCPLGSPSGSIPRSSVDIGAFRDAPSAATLPRCPRCGAPLRPHVLFFDEYYAEHRDYRYSEVERAAAKAAIMLFAGTSFAVGVTTLLLEAGARRSIPMFSVDPAGGRAPGFAPVQVLAAPAETLLPAVADSIRDASRELEGTGE